MDSIKVCSNDLVTVGPAAKALSVSRVTFYKWIEDGKVITIKLGDIVFVPVSEVERLKKERGLVR